MADPKNPVFLVITREGRAWTRMKMEGATYHGILASIYEEYQTAGGNWDRPTILMRDGKIVVPEKLADIAWSYGSELRTAQTEAERCVRARYTLAEA